MKDKILKLRAKGLSYRQIVKEVGCSSSTVSYYCGAGQKEKSSERQRKRRKTIRGITKSKIDRFRSRGLSMKTRDFRRERDLKGNWKGVGRNTNTFKEVVLLRKITDNPYCYLTGDKIDLYKPSSFSFDHIKPVSRGGDSTLSNLGLCTRDVNMSKHKLTVEEYIELCKKVLIHNGYKIESKPNRC